MIKSGNAYHFYLSRTPNYGVLGFDIQMNDIGIAMCHFELTARELGLCGEWVFEDPGLVLPDELTEYTVTWRGEN